MTPSANFYEPLRGEVDDDNPFRTGSEDEDDQFSPVLLTATDAAVAAPADATVMDALAAIDTDVVPDSSINTATDAADSARPPDDSPAITAAIVSAVQSSVAAAIEASLGAAIKAAIKTVRAEITSNHGHVTKRLFPELNDKSPPSQPQWNYAQTTSPQKGSPSSRKLLPSILSWGGALQLSKGGSRLWSLKWRHLRPPSCVLRDPVNLLMPRPTTHLQPWRLPTDAWALKRGALSLMLTEEMLL
jgi:hypothetical protein